MKRGAAAAFAIPLAFVAGGAYARSLLPHAPAAFAADRLQPLLVVTAWHAFGSACFTALALTVGVAAVALALAMRFAPADGDPALLVVPAAALSIVACWSWPFVFSSDVYAYAAYGDLALLGSNPYAPVANAAHDAFVDAARWQWGGVFPPCVYGPLFVALSQAVVATTRNAGVAVALFVFRVLAALAFLGSIFLLAVALGGSRRRRSLVLYAYGLNPTILWSVAEGHNDAFLLLAACGAAALAARGRAVAAGLALGLTPLLKAPGAVLAAAAALEACLIARPRRPRAAVALVAGTLVAAALAVPPVLPALAATARHGTYAPAVSVQALLGPAPAGLLAAAAAGYGLLRLARRCRAGFAWLGIALLLALPNIYPWYALWLVLFALASGRRFAAAALFGATISSVVRYLPDAAGSLSPLAVRIASALAALPLTLALVPDGAAAVFKKASAYTVIASLAFVLAVASAPLAAQTADPTPVPPQSTPLEPQATIPSAAPDASASPAGPAPATAAPVPAEAPSAAPSPSASPRTYKYRFVPHLPGNPQPGAPLIEAVYLNDAHLRSQGAIAIKVETNSAVVKVISRSNGREGLIPEVRPGDFEANSRLPKLPFIAAGMTIELEFVATSADGRKMSIRVPVKLD